LRTPATPESIKDSTFKERLNKIGAKVASHGSHRTVNVPGDFAAHRGAAAATTTSMRLSTVMR